MEEITVKIVELIEEAKFATEEHLMLALKIISDELFKRKFERNYKNEQSSN